ncbi:hypothetical protein SDRG_06505 [Saprolegnia diclina VS20]|uniref:EF-hand domain-containing protein n=1 Tax=Saprolegnia diclina (strain VS20) TaxID=1156394 RepID=T0QLZ7_SAPDV|nr:hypothetical protein SDRG_06505 [Saprolegnia diclina VS20]EQC35746.1 hypothetical protein SDRG_06505 [Saprolegnia diclina VS20]|eukprot:XP_008610508.1 hypothetical protein SDRG_06505 [Saprolegnia diclina VS20]
MDFEPEYALLRAATERAWAIEKRLGVSMLDYHMDDNRRMDWRTIDIPRDVASRIAHIATKLRDDPSMEMAAPKPLRRKPAVKPKAPVVTPVAVLPRAAPKPETPAPIAPVRVIKPANEARATALRKEIRDARAQKENDRNKANEAAKNTLPKRVRRQEPPPLSVATAPRSIEPLPVLQLTTPPRPLLATRSPPRPATPPLASPSPLAPSQRPVVASEAPAQPSSPSIPFEGKQVPDASSASAPSSPVHEDLPPRRVAPTQVPSAIGKQVLSDHRTMPSATFGFPADVVYGGVSTGPSMTLLRRLFNDLDSDRDGYLTKLEVSVALHRLRITLHPTRISLFFEQAAQLAHSSRRLIEFRQFAAFVLAAHQHPERDVAVAPPKPPPPPTTPVPAPIVVADTSSDAPPMHVVEASVTDYVVNRIVESLQSEMPPEVAASLDENVLRELTRQLLADQSKWRPAASIDELEPSQLTEPPPSEVHELEPDDDRTMLDLVKTLVQNELRREVATPPMTMPPPQPVVAKEVTDMATDTTGLAPPEPPSPVVEDKEVQVVADEGEAAPAPSWTLEDLPGRTLLGKLLHASPDQRASIAQQRRTDDPTPLMTTLRALRMQRLQRTSAPAPLNIAHIVPAPPVIPPPMTVVDMPPPPAPPLSPVTATSYPSQTRHEPEMAPAASKLYAVPLEREVVASLASLSRSSEVSASFSSESRCDSDRGDGMSEGELVEPNTLSDGEILDDPLVRATFYHTQKLSLQRKRERRRLSPSSSIESGELFHQRDIFPSPCDSPRSDSTGSHASSSSSYSKGSFTGSVRATSSTGSFESGQYAP